MQLSNTLQKSSSRTLNNWKYYDIRLNVGLRIPSLESPLTNKRKGFDGTVGVIGGSKEYTGAPYFAGMSALRTGADLVHIFTHPQASTVIKGYAPELIVHPTLIADSVDDLDIDIAAKKIASFFNRLDVLIVGPGLGRDPVQVKIAIRIIQLAKQENIPMVIDADGLHLLLGNFALIENYQKCVLTPNYREFERLLEAKKIPSNINSIILLSKALGNVSIVLKGLPDLIARDEISIECKTAGSARRVGGQGDILAGCVGTFLCWTLSKRSKQLDAGLENPMDPYLVASFTACHLVKVSASKAFGIHGRSMLTTHVIEQIGPSFREIFE